MKTTASLTSSICSYSIIFGILSTFWHFGKGEFIMSSVTSNWEVNSPHRGKKYL